TVIQVGRHHELPCPQTQQVILAHPAVHALVIDGPSLPLELCRHASPAVSGETRARSAGSHPVRPCPGPVLVAPADNDKAPPGSLLPTRICVLPSSVGPRPFGFGSGRRQ